MKTYDHYWAYDARAVNNANLFLWKVSNLLKDLPFSALAYCYSVWVNNVFAIHDSYVSLSRPYVIWVDIMSPILKTFGWLLCDCWVFLLFKLKTSSKFLSQRCSWRSNHWLGAKILLTWLLFVRDGTHCSSLFVWHGVHRSCLFALRWCWSRVSQINMVCSDSDSDSDPVDPFGFGFGFGFGW